MERAKNQWMASWLKRHPDRDEDAARSKWETLSIETKSHLMNISEMEIRIIEEIRVKLLKTLDEYPAPETLKHLFVEALKF
jgi:hypothetical protein